MPIQRHHFFSSPKSAADAEKEFFDPRCGCPQGETAPNADLIEIEEGLLARFEVAGCRREDLDLRVLDDALFLRGVRRDHCARRKVAYRQMEIHYGPFERSLTLPCAVDPEGARAEVRDGMLEVFLPRRRKTRRRPQAALVLQIRI